MGKNRCLFRMDSDVELMVSSDEEYYYEILVWFYKKRFQVLEMQQLNAHNFFITEVKVNKDLQPSFEVTRYKPISYADFLYRQNDDNDMPIGFRRYQRTTKPNELQIPLHVECYYKLVIKLTHLLISNKLNPDLVRELIPYFSLSLEESQNGKN